MKLLKSKLLSILTIISVTLVFSAFTNANHSTPSPVISGVKFASDNNPVSILSEKRLELINKAKEYVGLKYRYNGTTPKGFDCSGFTSFLYDTQLGIYLDHSSSGQSKFGKRVPLADAKAGDLLFFGVNGRIHHVGMVYSNEDDKLMMIHSSTSRGIIIENVWTSAYWRKRLMFVRDVISTELPVEEVEPVETF